MYCLANNARSKKVHILNPRDRSLSLCSISTSSLVVVAKNDEVCKLCLRVKERWKEYIK